MITFFIVIIALSVFLIGFIFYEIKKELIPSVIKAFPLDEPIYVCVNREALNNNYPNLNDGLHYLLYSKIRNGYVIRRPGNSLIFYKNNTLFESYPPPPDSYIEILTKPNRYKCFFILSIYFKNK